MKKTALALIAVIAATLSLQACKSSQPAPAPAPLPPSGGYGK